MVADASYKLDVVRVRVGKVIQEWVLRNRLGGPAKRCASCGAAIRWSVTPRGKMNPLNAEPGEDGCYVSHFSDCADANGWRTG